MQDKQVLVLDDEGFWYARHNIIVIGDSPCLADCLPICLKTNLCLLYNLHHIDHNDFIFRMEKAPREKVFCI